MIDFFYFSTICLHVPKINVLLQENVFKAFYKKKLFKHYQIYKRKITGLQFGSCALSGKMLLVMIIGNNKINAYVRSG